MIAIYCCNYGIVESSQHCSGGCDWALVGQGLAQYNLTWKLALQLGK